MRSRTTGTWHLSSAATLRTRRRVSRCCSCVPWERFRRNRSTPARTSPRSTVSSRLTGPRVAMILALRSMAGEYTECGKTAPLPPWYHPCPQNRRRGAARTREVFSHVRRFAGQAPGRLPPAQGRGQGHPRGARRGAAPDPHGAARGRRPLPGGQAVHRAGARARARPGGPGEPHPGAAGGQDRPRRADRAARRGGDRAPPRRPAGGHHALRPPGLGQDDHRRQARQAPEEARQASAAGGRRPPARRRRRAAQAGRQGGRRAGPRARAGGDRGRPRRPRPRASPASAATTWSSWTPPAASTSTPR